MVYSVPSKNNTKNFDFVTLGTAISELFKTGADKINEQKNLITDMYIAYQNNQAQQNSNKNSNNTTAVNNTDTTKNNTWYYIVAIVVILAIIMYLIFKK